MRFAALLAALVSELFWLPANPWIAVPILVVTAAVSLTLIVKGYA